MNLMPFAYEVYIPDFDERAYEQELLNRGVTEVRERVSEIAKGKALAAYRELKIRYPNEELMILSADTVVVSEGEMFGKGTDRDTAVRMLKRLNGKEHEVIGAVRILGDVEERSLLCVSKVFFANSPDSMIEHYVDTAKPFDKAGAYGIQDSGALFVKRIEGSYHNIMGLPLREVYDLLQEAFLKFN